METVILLPINQPVNHTALFQLISSSNTLLICISISLKKIHFNENESEKFLLVSFWFLYCLFFDNERFN